jgi:hypothetical protein
VYLQCFLLWVPTPILGRANAIIRQATYARYVSELGAHQISTLTICILYGVYVWVVLRFLGLQSPGQAIAVGLLWMVLTITPLSKGYCNNPHPRFGLTIR